MKLEREVLALMIATIAPLSSGTAQTAPQVASVAVTLTVPIDLSNLSPDITKVRVGCSIRSTAITNGNANQEVIQTQDLPVSGGAIRTQASLVFSLTNLSNPVGKNADVTCSLMGWSQPKQAWDQFTGAHPDPAFRTNATVGMITTTFVF